MTRRLYIVERVNVRNCFLDNKIYCTKILSGKFAFKSGHSKLELGRVLPEWLGEAVEAQVVQKMTSSHLVVSGSFTKMSPLQHTSGAEEGHCSDGQHQGRAEGNCPRSDENHPKVERSRVPRGRRPSFFGNDLARHRGVCEAALRLGAQRSLPTNLGGHGVLRGLPLTSG